MLWLWYWAAWAAVEAHLDRTYEESLASIGLIL